MPAQLTYRFATESDVPAVVALVESAYRGESSRAGWTTEADLLEGQRTDAAMVTDALARPGAHVLLAFDGPTLVACCELTEPGGAKDASASGTRAAAPHAVAEDAPRCDEPHGCSPESPAAGAAHLGMFAVRPTLQGCGVGKAVLEEAARIARDDWHAGALELTTIKQREELISWYERRGFARTGELRPFPYGEPRYGVPQRDDLEQAVLRRALR